MSVLRDNRHLPDHRVVPSLRRRYDHDGQPVQVTPMQLRRILTRTFLPTFRFVQMRLRMDLGATVRGRVRDTILRIVRTHHLQIQHQNLVNHIVLQSVAHARVHSRVYGRE